MLVREVRGRVKQDYQMTHDGTAHLARFSFSHESRKLDADVTKNVTSQILDVH